MFCASSLSESYTQRRLKICAIVTMSACLLRGMERNLIPRQVKDVVNPDVIPIAPCLSSCYLSVCKVVRSNPSFRSVVAVMSLKLMHR
jgi:hypothetical protein